MPKDLFTLASLTTLSGLVGLTYVSTNAVAQALGFRQTWLGLVVALFWTELGIVAADGVTALGIGIGVGNAFLVYLAAGGASQGVNAGLKSARSRQLEPQSSKSPTDRAPLHNAKFFAPWFGGVSA